MTTKKNQAPPSIPKKKRFKGGTLTWNEEGTSKSSNAWFRTLKDETILFRIPSYGPHHHLHLGIQRSVDEIEFFVQFSDERKPAGTADRKIPIRRSRPLLKSDFIAWGAWFRSKGEELQKLTLKMLLKGFRFQTFSTLRDLGWRSLPHKDELTKSDKFKGGKIELNGEDLQKMIDGPLIEPTKLLVDIKGHETKESLRLGYMIEVKKEELVSQWKEEKAKVSRSDAPSWKKESAPELLEWMDSNSNLEGDGPLYLVGDAVILLSHLGELLEFILQGALDSFKNQKASAWIREVRPKLAACLKEDNGIEELFNLLGLDLSVLLRPAFVDLDPGLSVVRPLG